MANKKDYFCKNCKNNNYGWCSIVKRNNLKEINNCIYKEEIGEIIDPIDKPLEDDIIAQANEYKEEKKTEEKNLIKEVLKENLRISLTANAGLVPGSKKINISIFFDNEKIDDINFNIK